MGEGIPCDFFLKEFLSGVSFCEGNHILSEEGKSFWLEEQFLVFLSLCWVLSVETAGKLFGGDSWVSRLGCKCGGEPASPQV